jgi:hypothetical protein
LRVQSKVDSLYTAGAATNSVAAYIRVCNVGSKAVSLSGAVVTFWYSEDGAAGDPIVELWGGASLISSKVVTELALTALREGVDGASTDANVAFTLVSTVTLAAGSVANPTCTDNLNMAIHSGTSWQAGFIPSNDWSYLASTSFANNAHVTLDLGASRLWGTTPALL